MPATRSQFFQRFEPVPPRQPVTGKNGVEASVLNRAGKLLVIFDDCRLNAHAGCFQFGNDPLSVLGRGFHDEYADGWGLAGDASFC